MIDKLSVDLSGYRLGKAKDLLEQAKLLDSNGKFDGSINRSYYAIFNAIRALLALIKLDSAKHSGVISFFDRYFVKTGIFDTEFSKIAHLAFDSRQDYDYEDFYMPSQEESKNQIKSAEAFIIEVKNKTELIVNGKVSPPTIE